MHERTSSPKQAPWGFLAALALLCGASPGLHGAARAPQDLRAAALGGAFGEASGPANSGALLDVLGDIDALPFAPESGCGGPACTLDLLRRAAEAGRPEAQLALARLLLGDAGDPQAMVFLSPAQNRVSELGLAESESLAWLFRAAALGVATAQNALGASCMEGLYGLGRDPERMLHWLGLAAAQDDPQALNNLGYAYTNGLGVPKDYLQAKPWLERAAALGHLKSMHNLGMIYKDQGGPLYDLAEARRWFELGAEGGLHAFQGTPGRLLS